MDIIFITVPVTLLFIATSVAIFFWANKGGQFDDLDSPAHRILFDDDIDNNDTASKVEDDDKDNQENKDASK